MSWISGILSRSSRKYHVILAFAIGVLLCLPSLPLTSYVSEGILQTLYLPFATIKNSINELRQVHVENSRLRESLVDANVKLSMLEEAGRENIRLRAVLGFEPPTGYTLLPARVISVIGDRIPIQAVLNRGYLDGVTVNEPIINEEGLLGKVVSVSHSFSTVQLLTDPTNRVAVRISESREMGIAKYLMSQGLIVDNVPYQGDVKQGDLVVSSGLGGLYPPGLVVGTVIAVERPKQDPFLSIRLAPAADFNSLDELFILRVNTP